MVSSPLANSFTTTGDVSFLGNVTVDGTLTVDSGGGNISVLKYFGYQTMKLSHCQMVIHHQEQSLGGTKASSITLVV